MQHQQIMSWIIERCRKSHQSELQNKSNQLPYQLPSKLTEKPMTGWDIFLAIVVKLVISCQKNQENFTVSIVPIAPKTWSTHAVRPIFILLLIRQVLNENGQVKVTSFLV
ncbi:hypothetical protein [Streptococcus phage phi-m46.1]|nr:hypothetical protein [Streptococcus phage phi-m46.1]